MSQETIFTIISIFILFLIAAVFLYVHINTLKKEALNIYDQILEKTRLRIDMVPNLIETLRSYKSIKEDLVKDFIHLRNSTWPIEQLTPEKVHNELHLSKHLQDIWKSAETNLQLMRDVNFLTLKKSFKDIAKEIEHLLELYNQKVRHHNKWAGIFHFKKIHIFEFEG